MVMMMVLLVVTTTATMMIIVIIFSIFFQHLVQKLSLSQSGGNNEMPFDEIKRS